jgi:Asp-tRNA(Asn)/Glu-tRNA(Gln) amidotransferase A subunit family amidase
MIRTVKWLGRTYRSLSVAILPLLLATSAEPRDFRVLSTKEPTITDIRMAIESKNLTCRQLAQMYLDRIEAYDKKGPSVNAIIVINPNALSNADTLDARFANSGFVGPLHCVPMIIKDNYDVVGFATTAGSLSLKDSMPLRDAFQIRKLREAGALILAKSNMAEFATSPFETIGSLLPGYTRNPYALDRVPAGSSGGTAAAVAASFGAAGLGTDTGNSIRGPASHTSLVGIRSTMGLTSRDGIVPRQLHRDIGGPLARSVADAVAVFDVIAGSDPADPVTLPADARRPNSYIASLDKDGLRGARIGVLRQLLTGPYPEPDADPEIVKLFEGALGDMKKQGAEIVEGINVAEIDEIPAAAFGGCNRFKHDLKAYLARLGSGSLMKSLDDIVAAQKFHPSVEKALLASQAASDLPPDQNPQCQEVTEIERRLADGVRKAMDEARVDVLVYPSWNFPPRIIGDLNSPHGNNSPRVAPPTGFPAVTVPMGFSRTTLPAGIQILGRPWSEPTLFKIAYSYEQATRHRRSPPSTPPLP